MRPNQRLRHAGPLTGHLAGVVAIDEARKGRVERRSQRVAAMHGIDAFEGLAFCHTSMLPQRWGACLRREERERARHQRTALDRLPNRVRRSGQQTESPPLR